MSLTKLKNGQRVPLTPSEQAQIEAEWNANAIVGKKLDLTRWAFMQTLADAGYKDGVQALIEALPPGPERSIALGKWNHDNYFTAGSPMMQSLSAVAEATLPGFDFDALWAQAEALQEAAQ